ncbi:hypothetical protein [Paraburkholderia aromaticivorans]|uniref:hypothetical protein n=1 Tax=Paraburkholderia aromaticivorans TaxID=2026199 RepID=UPI001980F397
MCKLAALWTGILPSRVPLCAKRRLPDDFSTHACLIPTYRGYAVPAQPSTYVETWPAAARVSGLDLERLRHLQLNPHHAFTQTSENRFALGRKNAAVFEFMLKRTFWRTVVDVDPAVEAANRLVRFYRNRPVTFANITRYVDDNYLAAILIDTSWWLDTTRATGYRPHNIQAPGYALFTQIDANCSDVNQRRSDPHP